MKICCTSDFHGFFPKIEPCDVVLICGDIVDLYKQSSTKGCRKWYQDVFKPWAENLPCKKVLFIAGNHEVAVEHHECVYKYLFPKEDKVTYLSNELYTFKNGLRVFGSPYCKIFGNWAYMKDDEGLKEKYSEIPEYIDILMTHDAPYGTTDVCLEGWNTEHLGNKPLRDAILAKNPEYVIHGHLHSANHDYEWLGKSKVINCSYVNEQYEPTYQPIYIDTITD